MAFESPCSVVRQWRPVACALAMTVLSCVAAALLSGFFLHPHALGSHDWDQMESNRYFVVKSIRDFHQFPFWDPYGCGGFPAWGSPESATIAVSPFLPVYLALPLGTAIRVELVALVFLLLGGCWVFARRYIESPLALGFACLVAALNSRTALQAAVGHTWHLYYAGMPWVLAAFDRAQGSEPGGESRRLGWLACGVVAMTFMIYGGGIYPVPQTALCILGLAAYRSVASRTMRPLLVAGVMGAWSAALAAPKLFAILETMTRFPRLVPSRETIPPLFFLRMFLSSSESFPNHRAENLDYLWHEYGQYIGLLPFVLILWATLRTLPPQPELRSLRFVGWSLMLLALGGWGPWVLLHLVPPFCSQHVPSRFTFPAVLLLAVVAGHVLERRARIRQRFAPAWVVPAVSWLAFLGSAALIAREDMRCTRPWFGLAVPDVPERTAGYVQYDDLPNEYAYGDGDYNSPRGTNGPPGLLVRRANVGAIRCTGFTGLNMDAPRGSDGRPLHLGARGVGDPAYRGEVWVEPSGRATLQHWSPSEVVVTLRDLTPGSLVVLNQNWFAGWTANGEPALDYQDVVAHRVSEATESVTFRYRPVTWRLSLFVLAGGLAVAPFAWLWVRTRRPSRRAGRRAEPRNEHADG